MPLTKTGKRVLEYLQRKHGEEAGKRIFYASINKGVPGSSHWEKRRRRRR